MKKANQTSFRKGQKFSFPKTCAICNKKFIGNTGSKKYCDSCRTAICESCGKKFEFHPNRIAKFCSRSCRAKHYYYAHPELKEKLKKALPLGKDHPLYRNGRSSYRQKALRELPNECDMCGYKKHIEILSVHHKDFDRENNKINNLQVLCTRCHHELHLEANPLWRLRKSY